MSIFSRKETSLPEPEITGTEAIRRRFHARWRKVNLARTAMDLSIPLPQLEAFAKGESNRLSVAHMHALCKEVYPYHTAFDPEKDKLVGSNCF